MTPEFEIHLTFRGDYDDRADAFEHADMVAASAEQHHPDVAIDVELTERG